MAKEKIIVGLDIGTSKIATIVAKIDDNMKDLEIIGVGISESSGIKKRYGYKFRGGNFRYRKVSKRR